MPSIISPTFPYADLPAIFPPPPQTTDPAVSESEEAVLCCVAASLYTLLYALLAGFGAKTCKQTQTDRNTQENNKLFRGTHYTGQGDKNILYY